MALSKMLLWALVELYFFMFVIDDICKGLVYVYGLILAIGHGIIVLGLCCKAVQHCRERDD